MIRCKLTGSYQLLKEKERDWGDDIKELLHPASWRHITDCGAYTGDSAELFMSLAPGLVSLTALEPDPHSFARLVKRAEASGGIVSPVNCAAWSREDTLMFRKGGSRSSRITDAARSVPVRACPCDAICRHDQDFIKLDVEGAEGEALEGMREIISLSAPELCVSLYHRIGDIFDLPLQIKAMRNDYTFSLRRSDCLPAWDLYLYATVRR